VSYLQHKTLSKKQKIYKSMFRCLISRKVEKRQRLLIVTTYESTDITISKVS